jgi:hypothetical protein
MKNNLFYYATSELSQDAFLAWLSSFAMAGCQKNAVLTACAKQFLRQFVPALASLSDEEIYLSKEPERQYKHVDILLTINDRYKIIIEDKTYTNEHDDQLQRYIETIKVDFPAYEVFGIYYKSSFQSNVSAIKEAGYAICSWKEAYELFSKYVKEADNHIFKDYVDLLKDFYDQATQYEKESVEAWNWVMQCAFFADCQSRLNAVGINASYGYVHNQQGGFYALWRTPIILPNVQMKLYWQLEYQGGALELKVRARHLEGADGAERKMTKKDRDLLWSRDSAFIKEYDFVHAPHWHGGKTSSLYTYPLPGASLAEALVTINKKFESLALALSSLPSESKA